jgi:putative hemolysin
LDKGGENFPAIVSGLYEVRLAKNAGEIASALRLRHQVFNVEMGSKPVPGNETKLEFDAYDFKCRHLIVISRETGETIGTYRLNDIETAKTINGFYSSNEFTIGDLPDEVLRNGVEIGRACIDKEHRNTRVLFLLWKGLLNYLESRGKRYFFGCCSIFTSDESAGADAYHQLLTEGHIHESFSVAPCRNAIELANDNYDDQPVTLPALFNMYLRIGAKVCGPPMIDREFGTIDFFVIFDVTKLNEKYRRMFG